MGRFRNDVFSMAAGGACCKAPCASWSIVQGTVLIQNAPDDVAIVEADVAIADAEPDDFISRISNEIDAEVNVIGDCIGSFELEHLEFLPDNDSDGGNIDAECFNCVHEVVVVFAIVNLLQFGQKIISRGECFGEFHGKGERVGVGGLCLNHEHSMAAGGACCKAPCASCQGVTPLEVRDSDHQSP